MTTSDLGDLELAFPEARLVIERAGHDPIQTLATAESCTGGLLAAALTAVPGSSRSFRGGVVAYANSLKHQALGVTESSLAAHGAVSQEVAEAMAEGVRLRFQADWGIATTGVSGPGASEAKPAGLAWVAVATAEGARVRRLDDDQGRHRNRVNVVRTALGLLLEVLR